MDASVWQRVVQQSGALLTQRRAESILEVSAARHCAGLGEFSKIEDVHLASENREATTNEVKTPILSILQVLAA